MYKRVKEQVHFIGIGGIGMSGIAEVLVRQGFPVSGSDLSDSETVRRLRELGVKIFLGHRAENLVGSKVVVVSSAIAHDNPELLEGQRQGIPIVPRAEMLAELINAQHGLGYLLMTSQRRGLSEHILLILIVIGLLAFGIDRLLFWVERGLFPYRTVEERP